MNFSKVNTTVEDYESKDSCKIVSQQQQQWPKRSILSLNTYPKISKAVHPIYQAAVNLLHCTCDANGALILFYPNLAMFM